MFKKKEKRISSEDSKMSALIPHVQDLDKRVFKLNEELKTSLLRIYELEEALKRQSEMVEIMSAVVVTRESVSDLDLRRLRDYLLNCNLIQDTHGNIFKWRDSKLPEGSPFVSYKWKCIAPIPVEYATYPYLNSRYDSLKKYL